MEKLNKILKILNLENVLDEDEMNEIVEKNYNELLEQEEYYNYLLEKHNKKV